MDSRADSFFSQLPLYERNPSAKRFDQLAAELGFSPNDASSLINRPNSKAASAHRAINTSLKHFLKTQSAKTSGPLGPIPEHLSTYLDHHAELILTIQAHLLEQPVPQWDMTLDHMFDPAYPHPGFFNVRNLQEVLLISAIDYNDHGQHLEMVKTLEASWRLNQALLQRPDLTAKVSVSAVSDLQTGLLRHLDNVPEAWQTRLVQQAQQQSVIEGQQFEAWLQYKVQQESLTASAQRLEASTSLGDKLASTLFYWFSPAHIIQLRTFDTIETMHQSLGQLKSLKVCAIPQDAVEQVLEQQKTAKWNGAIAINSKVWARRWKVAGDRALNLELTQKVLQAKQLRKETGEWPTELPNMASATCPDEHWSYILSKDNIATFTFSNEPLATVYPAKLDLGVSVPLSYQSFVD